MSTETRRSTPAPDSAADLELRADLPARFAEAAGDMDPDLVARTKRQIGVLVQEIARLAESDCELEEFFQGFLVRTTSALGGVGGAIWLKNADGALELKYQINLAQTVLGRDEQAQQRHTRLLLQLLSAGESALVPPHSGDGQASGGNPTEHLLVIGPLQLEQEVVGLVEILQRSGSGPATQRGYQRFVVQMSELASGYLKNRRLRQFSNQRELWVRLEQFIRAIHHSLDPRETAFAIANEARRLIECDRVSVALRSGRHTAIQAVSGLDSLERRAEQIKYLNRLATAVVNGRGPLWYSSATTELPPQIEQSLHPYVDRAHTKMLAIIPLRRAPLEPAAPGSTPPPSPILGALIVEQMTQPTVSTSLRQRIEVAAAHSGDALANALDHGQIFLLPLWRGLGRCLNLVRGKQLPKTALVASVVAALAALLAWFPYPFTLGANGQLRPATQFEVFAQVDGTLDEVFVPDDPEAIVEAGQPLARMTSNELQVEVRDLEGQQLQLRETIRSLERAIGEDMERLERLNLERELGEAIEREKGIANQLLVKRRDLELLNVTAPASGQVVDWQLRQNLLHRPVRIGQSLMTLVPPDTEWELELQFPEKRLAHLLAAARQVDAPLPVTFCLASHPGREYRGTIRQIDQRLEVRGAEGNVALVRVAFDTSDLPPELLRGGTRLSAQVHCGSRSVGYVWFHELGETLHSAWLKWF
jgi:multidrug resistance efflux pump